MLKRSFFRVIGSVGKARIVKSSYSAGGIHIRPQCLTVENERSGREESAADAKPCSDVSGNSLEFAHVHNTSIKYLRAPPPERSNKTSGDSFNC